MPVRILCSGLALCAALTLCGLLVAQSPTNPPPDQRYKADLLVVVAHPDDETAIGAYLARAIFDQHRRVAAVFGNNGISGGNAEGQEQADALGDVREIEARRALAHFGVMNVWFLRGRDTPGQDVLRSLENWNHGDQLERLVRIVRLTRPSVIATWLPEVTAGEDHGDHQAAGVLASEAFDLAGDPSVFPEQAATPRNREGLNNLTEGLRPWQPEKIYYFTDAEHSDFIRGKGPVYSATDISPSRGVPYARLAAEECAFHLTQSDTGQFARAALSKAKAPTDFGYLSEPVRLIFGKSYVDSGIAADVFTGVQPDGIPYRQAPGYKPDRPPAPRLSLGGAWRFYREFWPTHGLNQIADLVAPEILLNFESPITVPVLIENPTPEPLTFTIQTHIPAGWIYWHQAPASVTVRPHSEVSFSFEARSPVKPSEALKTTWDEMAVSATYGGQKLGPLNLKIGVGSAGMPQ